MAYQLFRLPKAVGLDNAVRALSGAKAYFYETGTITPQNTYSDAELTTPHAHPVVADAAGVFPPIYLDPSLIYRLTLRSSADVLIYTVDPVNDQAGQHYARTPAEIAVGVTPDDYSYTELYVQRYGNDESAIRSAIAVQAQIGAGTIVLEENGNYTVDADFDIDAAQNLTIDGRGSTITSSSRITQLFQLTGEASHVTIKNLHWSPPAYAGSGSSQARMVLVNGNIDFLEIDHCTATNGALITCEAPASGQARCNVIRITNCKADGQGVNPSNGMQIGGYRQCFVDGCEITGYLLDGIKLTITRVETSSQLTDPFEVTSGNYRVVVNHAAHNMLDGDRVTFDNASAVGGITIDGQYKISRVLDGGSYEIVHTAAASSTATGGGTVDVTVRYPLTEMTSIKRCIFHNNDPSGPDSGIDIFGGGRHTIIEENEFHYLASGVMFKRENNGGGGTDLAGDVTRAVIAKNKFFDCENPVYVRLADHCRIKDNYFERCGAGPAGTSADDTITVIGPLTDLEISGNTFTGNLGREMDITAATVTGLSLDEVHATIRDNKFYDSQGVCIYNTSSINNRFVLDIRGNWFFRHGDDALELRGYGGSVFNIEGNYFVDSASDALDEVTMTATDTVFWGNNYFVDHTSPGDGIVGPPAGVYTPTITNVANLDASTAYACQYMRVGRTVTVSGRVDVDPTAAGSTQLGISLPIASNIGNSQDCAGVAFAFAFAGLGAAILGDPTNNRATMQWIAGDTTSKGMLFTFTYQVI